MPPSENAAPISGRHRSERRATRAEAESTTLKELLQRHLEEVIEGSEPEASRLRLMMCRPRDGGWRLEPDLRFHNDHNPGMGPLR